MMREDQRSYPVTVKVVASPVRCHKERYFFYMRALSLWYKRLGEGFVHCIVDVSREVWPHATSVLVVKRVNWVGTAQTMSTDTPKGLLVLCVRLTTRVSRNIA